MTSEDKAEAHILPKANIDRMIIASLPLASKTSRESKIILQYLASEFLAFIASEADSVSKVWPRATASPRAPPPPPVREAPRALITVRARAPDALRPSPPRRRTSVA